MQYFARLSKEQEQDILKDIGTDEESLKRNVNSLIDWLEKTPYLPSVKDEAFISSVLIGCKNRMERAKTFLDSYYCRRTLGSDMFACRNPQAEEIQKSRKFFATVPLPRLTADGHRIITMTYGDVSLKDLPQVSSLLSMWQMEHEVMLKSDRSKGYINIVDAKNFNVAAVTMFLTDINKLQNLLTKTTRGRIKATYIMNFPPAGLTFFDMLKHMLSEKMLGRIHIWSKKPEELVEVLPKSVLPSDFGGDERSLDEIRGAWHEYVGQFAGWFKAEENVKADLNKRPQNDDLSQEIQAFGSSGSFRKMNLD